MEAAWEKATPITKEDVRGDVEPEPTVADREIVAHKMAEVLKPEKAEPSPLEERLARIESALSPEPEPTKPSIEAEVAQLRQLILERETEARARVEAEEREAQINGFREGVIHNLKEAAQDFPGLTALGYEENVFNSVFEAAQAGESVSEYDVAEQAEAQLRAQYEKLHAVYGEVSDTPVQSDEPKEQTPTLTPTLTSDESPIDIQELAKKGELSRRELAELAWEKTQK